MTTDAAVEVDAEAVPEQPTAPPPGWGAGMWRLDGRNDAAGWLPIPARVDDVDAWVGAKLDELRTEWADDWTPEAATAAEQLLRAGLDARPDDAAQAFQVWPLRAPIVAHVDVAFGEPPAGGAPREGILYEAEGLGVGVQTVQRVVDEQTGAVLIGMQISFVSADAAVVVTFHPTFGELLTMLVGQFHALVQSLELFRPDGSPVLAQTPAGFVALEGWADSLPSP